MAETMWFLKRCELFERLTTDEAERIERNTLIRRFNKGEIIYFPRDTAETVLLVGSGRVVIGRAENESKGQVPMFY